LFPTKQNLKDIGIEKRGHRRRLQMEIEKLPQVEIAQEVPVSQCRHPAWALGTESGSPFRKSDP